MKFKNSTFIAVLFTALAIFNVSATEKEHAVILIEAQIYKHPTASSATSDTDFDELLTGADLESEPVLIMAVGGEAQIEIGVQQHDGSDDDMLRLAFKSESLGTRYTVDFQLSSQNNKKISTVVADVNTTLILSSKLKGSLKIVKIKTRKFATLALALAAKDENKPNE